MRGVRSMGTRDPRGGSKAPDCRPGREAAPLHRRVDDRPRRRLERVLRRRLVVPPRRPRRGLGGSGRRAPRPSRPSRFARARREGGVRARAAFFASRARVHPRSRRDSVPPDARVRREAPRRATHRRPRRGARGLGVRVRSPGRGRSRIPGTRGRGRCFRGPERSERLRNDPRDDVGSRVLLLHGSDARAGRARRGRVDDGGGPRGGGSSRPARADASGRAGPAPTRALRRRDRRRARVGARGGRAPPREAARRARERAADTRGEEPPRRARVRRARRPQRRRHGRARRASRR